MNTLRSAVIAFLSSTTISTEKELVELADQAVDLYLDHVDQVRAIKEEDLDSTQSILTLQDFYVSELMISGAGMQGLVANAHKYQSLRTNHEARHRIHHFAVHLLGDIHNEVKQFRAARASDPDFIKAMAT